MNKPYQNKEWLEEQFRTVKFAQTIGKSIGVSGDTIEYWRKKFEIEKSRDNRMSARKYTLNHDYFEEIDNEFKAYWLGFIVADGCVTSSNKNGPTNRFEFNLKKSDYEHLEKFKEAVGSDQKVRFIVKNNKKRGFVSTVCNLRINSKRFCENLSKFGVNKGKTGNEYIPNIPDDLISHFIRGYFDGDGSITGEHNYSVKLCSSSKRLINQVVKIFNNELNIKLNIQDYSNKYEKEFYIIESRNQKNNPKILQYLYSNASVYLDRKYKKAMDLITPLLLNVIYIN